MSFEPVDPDPAIATLVEGVRSLNALVTEIRDAICATLSARHRLFPAHLTGLCGDWLQHTEQAIRAQDASDAHALTVIKSVADELRTAGAALEQAAAALKQAGKGLDANRAHVAGQRATRSAQELLT